MAELFQTKRNQAIKLYEKAGQPFVATTKPYVSSIPVIWDVVSAYPAAPATPVMAHAVARAGQSFRWFSYGVGNNIGDGFGNQYNATDDDTNQTDSNNTNGGEDFVIEGMSSTARSVRALYPANQALDAIADVDVLNWYRGIIQAQGTVPAAGLDPAALGMPPQHSSPYNLESVLYSAVAPHISLNFQFDRKKVEYIGTLDEFPEGGGKSYLRANGEPRTDNRYRIPEGYVWRRKGQKDSDFNVIGTLQRAVIVPITLVPLLGSASGEDQIIVVPQRLVLDVKLRAHGLALDFPSQN